MSRSGRVRLFYGEGDFDFCVQIGELVALEEIRATQFARMGFGPEHASCERIAERLGGGSPLIGEVREVLRLGLVGGGMEKMQAHDLVARHLVAGSLLECARIAYAVLGAALVGAPQDPPGDQNPGETNPGEPKGRRTRKATKPASPTGVSAGRSSTGSARRSVSTRVKSTG